MSRSTVLPTGQRRATDYCQGCDEYTDPFSGEAKSHTRSQCMHFHHRANEKGARAARQHSVNARATAIGPCPHYAAYEDYDDEFRPANSSIRRESIVGRSNLPRAAGSALGSYLGSQVGSIAPHHSASQLGSVLDRFLAGGQVGSDTLEDEIRQKIDASEKYGMASEAVKQQAVTFLAAQLRARPDADLQALITGASVVGLSPLLPQPPSGHAAAATVFGSPSTVVTQPPESLVEDVRVARADIRSDNNAGFLAMHSHLNNALLDPALTSAGFGHSKNLDHVDLVADLTAVSPSLRVEIEFVVYRGAAQTITDRASFSAVRGTRVYHSLSAKAGLWNKPVRFSPRVTTAASDYRVAAWVSVTGGVTAVSQAVAAGFVALQVGCTV